MELITLKTEKIKVKEDLKRYRQDLGKIKEFASSIKRIGQLQPIGITRDYHLVFGGRRLEACKLLKREISCVFTDTLTATELRIRELEENFQRKNFTPGEYCLAVRDIHLLKQKEHGTSGSGKAGGWTLDQTAELLGKTRGSIINDIKNADMIDVFPELVKVKKKSAIKKAARGLEKLNLAITGLNDLKEVKEDSLVQFHFTDSLTFMPTLKASSINILLTDPLYGIEHEKVAILGNPTFSFTDSTDKGLAVYYFLAQESFRFTKDSAHGYIFLAPEHFTTIREMFLMAGWQAYIKPLIWIKPNIGQCNLPTHYPSSSYEMILYIRKAKAKIVKEGQPDYIIQNAVVGNNKDHIYEKPVPLLVNLLDRVSIPGNTLFDPFAGSCSSLIAGREKQLKVIGCDNSKEAFAIGNKKINDYLNREE